MGSLNINTTDGTGVITDAVWFSNPTIHKSTTSPHGCVGIVTVEYYNKTYRKFIGLGQGFDEKEDAILISEWGSTFANGDL